MLIFHFRVNRECSKDITIKGIKIECGVTVSAPIYAIHYDEKNYPDPFKFDPDRQVLAFNVAIEQRYQKIDDSLMWLSLIIWRM